MLEGWRQQRALTTRHGHVNKGWVPALQVLTSSRDANGTYLNVYMVAATGTTAVKMYGPLMVAGGSSNMSPGGYGAGEA